VHTGIEKLASKRMPQAVDGVALVGKAGSLEGATEDETRTVIGEAGAPLTIEEQDFACIPLREPLLQGVPHVVTQIDNTALSILFPFRDGDGALLEVDVTDSRLKNLPDPHPGAKKNKHHGSIPSGCHRIQQSFHISWLYRPWQTLGKPESDSTAQDLGCDEFLLDQKVQKGVHMSEIRSYTEKLETAILFMLYEGLKVGPCNLFDPLLADTLQKPEKQLDSLYRVYHAAQLTVPPLHILHIQPQML
jgi:hypothetical protein